MMQLPSPSFGVNSNALALNNAFNNAGNNLAFNNPTTNNSMALNNAFNTTNNNLAMNASFSPTTNNLNTAINNTTFAPNISPVNNTAISNTIAPVNNTYAPVNNTATSVSNTYVNNIIVPPPVFNGPVPQLQPQLGQDMFAPQFGGIQPPCGNGIIGGPQLGIGGPQFGGPQMLQNELAQNQMIGGLMNAVQNLTSMVSALIQNGFGRNNGGDCGPCGNVAPANECGGIGLDPRDPRLSRFSEDEIRHAREVRYFDEEGREHSDISVGGTLLGAGLGFALGGPLGLVLGGIGGAVLGKPIGRLVGGVVEGAGEVIGGVAKGVGKVAEGIGKGIGSVAKGVGNAIKKIF